MCYPSSNITYCIACLLCIGVILLNKFNQSINTVSTNLTNLLCVDCSVDVFVGRNLWICDIHGSACAIDGSIVCAEIHGYLRNLWIMRRMQIISL